MRWLFLLLVIANLLFFVWTKQHESSLNEVVPGKPDVGDIRVVSEAEVAQLPEGDTSRATQQRYCSSLGFFSEREMAERLGKALAATGIASSIHSSLQTSVIDYRVIIPPVSDGESEAWIMQKLVDSGFESPWEITSGELRGSISLGVFKNRDNARAQKIKTERLGLETEIIERTEEKEVFWVHLKDQLENLATEEVVKSLQKTFGAFEIQDKRCLEIVQKHRNE